MSQDNEAPEYWCHHCDGMFPCAPDVDPETVIICPACQIAGHHGGICTKCANASNLEGGR